MTSELDGKEVLLDLTNVLFIPDLSTNLISVGSADKRGVKTVFAEKTCMMMMGDVPLLMGNCFGSNLYLLRVKATKQRQPRVLICKEERTLSEWHRVLGHVSEKRIKALADDQGVGIKVIKQHELDCSECSPGKGKRSSHPLSTAESMTWRKGSC